MSLADIFDQKNRVEDVVYYICVRYSSTIKLLNMIKSLSILAFVLSCITVVSAQHQRRVMIEEFTNASCGPCAAQNPGFHSLLTQKAAITTVIKYQTALPGYDPMNLQNPSEVQTRENYYVVTGVPTATINGKYVTNDCNAYDGAPACLSGAEIVAANNNLTPVTMSIVSALSEDKDSVILNVSVTSDAALSGALRLHVAVLEDEINFSSAPGTNGEKNFYEIMRKMLPNAGGTSISSFAAGETKNYTFRWPISNFYNLNRMAAIAFLQNNTTKEIYQSARANPLPPLSNLMAKISPANLYACATGYSPSITVNNTGSEAITTIHLRYRQGTGPWKFFDWTGNIAPGASEKVLISDLVINDPGSIKLDVLVLNTNLGYQLNYIDGLTTYSIKALFNTPLAAPFGNDFQDITFPPANWSTDNVGVNGWKLATNAGAGSTRSARCNFFDLDAGEVAIFNTPKFDLSGATSATKLNFDHAYAYKNVLRYDSLRIQISSNCGETWETIFNNGKAGLATAPIHNGTSGWIPEASEWQANTLDISTYNGQPEVLIRFVGKSGNGNNLFLDNVNVSTTVGTKDLTLSTFNLVPNPSRNFAEVRFGLETAQKIELLVYNAEGALVQSQLLGELSSGEHRVDLNATSLSAGSYRVVLQGTEGLAQTQWLVVK